MTKQWNYPSTPGSIRQDAGMILGILTMAMATALTMATTYLLRVDGSGQRLESWRLKRMLEDLSTYLPKGVSDPRDIDIAG